MAHDRRDNPSQAITVTNWTEDLTLDCDELTTLSGSILLLGDILGTVINELQDSGILRGTTSA